MGAILCQRGVHGVPPGKRARLAVESDMRGGLLALGRHVIREACCLRPLTRSKFRRDRLSASNLGVPEEFP